jgi:hypothetical protein
MIPGLCSMFYRGSGGTSGGFSATATPTALGVTGIGLQDTGNFTATPIGGTPPYTYSWIYVMGDPNITIISPTTASAHARCFIGTGDHTQGFVACIVTDSASHAVTTDQVTITFDYPS